MHKCWFSLHLLTCSGQSYHSHLGKQRPSLPWAVPKEQPPPQIWGPQPSLCYLCSWIGFFLHLPFKSESSQLAPSAASHSPTPGSDRSILMPLEEGLIKPMLEPKAWHIPCGTQWEMKVRSSPSKNWFRTLRWYHRGVKQMGVPSELPGP